MPTIELESRPIDDSALLVFPPLTDVDGLAHAVTTRPWNMAAHRGPESDRAVDRRRRLCAALNLPFERLTAPDQVHSPHVWRIEARDVGAGRDGRATALKFVDGLICHMPKVPVIQFSADCPLLLVVEPRARVFGMAHASWRGTVTQIARELLNRLQRDCSADPANCLAAIAPCAGPDEYEVGQDVRRIALDRLSDAESYFRPRGEKWTFDMRGANVAQLVAGGVPAERIYVAAHSTMSDPRFFSHRRDGADTGRFALIAGFAR